MRLWRKVSEYDRLHEIIGKNIEKVFLSKDKEELLFKTGDNYTKWVTDADCCSETWIEHVNLPWNFGKVEHIEEINLGEVLPSRQESDELYGVRLTTDGGTITIEFRNSSNGYYGGSMMSLGEYSKDKINFERFDELTESV